MLPKLSPLQMENAKPESMKHSGLAFLGEKWDFPSLGLQSFGVVVVSSPWIVDSGNGWLCCDVTRPNQLHRNEERGFMAFLASPLLSAGIGVGLCAVILECCSR